MLAVNLIGSAPTTVKAQPIGLLLLFHSAASSINVIDESNPYPQDLLEVRHSSPGWGVAPTLCAREPHLHIGLPARHHACFASDLISFLKALPDCRMRRGIRFPQWWMLLVAILSILSGQGSLVGMERFAKRHL
jgi:hypothetical protein